MAGGGIPQSQNPRVQLPVRAPVPVQAGFSAGIAPAMPSMNSPFRGGMSTTTGMTGMGGYGGVQAMREGGIARYEGGGIAKSDHSLDDYRYFRSAQDAYDRTLAMGQSQAYRDWYYSLNPATRSYGAQPPATGPDDPMWIYLAEQAKNNYEVFGGTNPFTGQSYAPPTTTTTSTAPSTGSRVQPDIGQPVNNLTQEELNRLAIATPAPKPTGTGGTGTGGGGTSTGGGGTGTGGGGTGTGGGGTGTGGGGTGTGGGGTGTGGGGTGTGSGTWGGGFGQTNPYAPLPPPAYNAPEYPNLAFGYPWIPEELKALRAQRGLVPGGGGISTVPPSVSTTPISSSVPTKAAKSGGIMSLMRRRG